MDHDDDIDVGVLADVGWLMADFAAAGILLRRSRLDTYYQIYDSSRPEYGKDPHIDIFRFVDIDGILLNEDSRFRNASQIECNMSFRVKDLMPLVKVKFHGHVAYVPKNSPRCIGIRGWQNEIRARHCPIIETSLLNTEGQPMAAAMTKYIREKWLADVDRCAKIVLRRLKRKQSGCIVMDIDETILQNASIKETEFALPLTEEMRQQDIGHFLPGALKISDWCAKHSVNIYLITGRSADIEEQTVQNLAGFIYKKIYFRPHGVPTLVHKIVSRADIKEEILITAGDQYTDHIGGHTGFIVKYPSLYIAL
jgi:hypothetical protein